MRIDLVYGNAAVRRRGHRRLRRPRGAQGQPQGRQGAQRPRARSSSTSPSSHSREHGGRASRLARRVGAMPLDVRPIDRRDAPRVRHRALGVLPAVPVLGRRQGGVGTPLARLVRRPDAGRRRSRPAAADPRLERYLAYLPEGPVLDWAAFDAARRAQPAPVRVEEAEGVRGEDRARSSPVRRWSAATLKAAIADGTAKRLRDVPPDSADKDAVALADALTELRWRQVGDTGRGLRRRAAPVRLPAAAGRAHRGRSCSPASTSSGGATSRRPTRPASRCPSAASTTSPSSTSSTSTTAERDGFTPRGLAYFQRMWNAMRPRTPSASRSTSPATRARLLAATTAVRVGAHVWYSYGASADHRPRGAPQQRHPVAR